MNANCYICGIGSGICDPCRGRHLTAFGFDKYEPPSPPRARPLTIAPKSISYNAANQDEAFAEARRQGMSVLQADVKSHLVLLDLDSLFAAQQFNAMIDFVDSKFKIDRADWWWSESGHPHRHVALQMTQELTTAVRIAIEGALGSDPSRTILNLYRYTALNDLAPSVLFVPKNATIYALSRPFRLTRS